MLETLNAVFQQINKMSEGNQLMAGAISMWGLGVITYICRSVPLKILRFVTKHLTTTVTVTSYNITYHNLMTWFKKEGFSDKLRKVKLGNGRWGSSDTVKTVGYGSHIIWYNWAPVKVTVEKFQNNSADDKEMITLTKLGRSHKVFNALIKQVSKDSEKGSANNVQIYKYVNKSWTYLSAQPKRPMNSVFLPEKTKTVLLNRIQRFIDREDWYISNGIPYQLGILLYGPPGTGKTSLVQSLAGYFDKKMSILRAGDLWKASDAMPSMRDNSFLVVEDVDSFDASKKRDNSEVNDVEKIEETESISEETENSPVLQGSVRTERPGTGSGYEEKLLQNMRQSGISELLNAVDGIIRTHGRVMFLTTNYPEKLGEALLRPGRVDLKVKLDYVDIEVFKQFMDKFFPENSFDPSGYILSRDDVTCAQLQECILSEMSAEDILEKYTEPA
jgi:SpoVK/Ycf46/Vps4 family AAA+-type ATPase